ncbi:MAG TPA: hypothetical protein VHC19_29585 [Pirellulales bacterium]|nr:hypothetical protein [Pirellulales bacterium]
MRELRQTGPADLQATWLDAVHEHEVLRTLRRLELEPFAGPRPVQ